MTYTAMDQGLRRAEPAPECVRDTRDVQVGVEPQHQRRPLTLRQPPKLRPHLIDVLRQRWSWRHRRVTPLDLDAAKVSAGEVRDRRRQVRSRIPDTIELRPDPSKRLLRELVGNLG